MIARKQYLWRIYKKICTDVFAPKQIYLFSYKIPEKDPTKTCFYVTHIIQAPYITMTLKL